MSRPMGARPDTAAVHAGRYDLSQAHVPPIDLSSTYLLADVESGGDSYETLAGGGRPPGGGSMVYQRLWNPTVARFEEGLAELESAEDAVGYASGMAGLSPALLAARAAGPPPLLPGPPPA